MKNDILFINKISSNLRLQEKGKDSHDPEAQFSSIPMDFSCRNTPSPRNTITQNNPSLSCFL